MRMTLVRYGLLGHVKFFKPEAEMTEAWVLTNMKALEIIVYVIPLKHQVLVCNDGHACMGHVEGVLQSHNHAQPGVDDPPPSLSKIETLWNWPITWKIWMSSQLVFIL